MDDNHLIRRVLDGDASAERELYLAHVNRVYRLAYRMTGDSDLAQDCTQETFVRTFDRLAQFRGDAAFTTWLTSIATSVVLNALRKVKRFRQRETDLDESLHVASRTRNSEPDLKERMKKAIDGLPTGYRAVFVMHDIEGYTHEEIGAALGVQSGTSKAQLSRARARLREELADFAGEYA